MPPDERLSSYPHQFYGGMSQRVAIAIAFLNEPDLIVADEPTTAIDVTIHAQILHEAQTMCRETGPAMNWTSHDPIRMAHFCTPFTYESTEFRLHIEYKY